MSIRTRVMVGTLGLAVIGFVGTLGAAEGEILIVRDGSVDLNVVNSRLSDRGERRNTSGARRPIRWKCLRTECGRRVHDQ